MTISSDTDEDTMLPWNLLQIATVMAFICSTINSLSPIPTMTSIWRRKTVGTLHIAPFLAMVLNHALALWYAWAAGVMPMVYQRLLSLSLSAIYLCIYTIFSTNRKVVVMSVMATLLVLVAVGVETTPLLISGRSTEYTKHIGIIYACASIVFNTSPLLVLPTVFRTRDISALPVPFCLVNSVSCASWLTVGYLSNDTFMTAGNAWGSISSIAQIATIAYFTLDTKLRHKKKNIDVNLDDEADPLLYKEP